MFALCGGRLDDDRGGQGGPEEIKRQFAEIPGLREGNAEPDGTAIVDIATKAALSQMVLPGSVAILAPVGVGFLLGPASLAGMLAGATAVGASLSLFMANAGGRSRRSSEGFGGSQGRRCRRYRRRSLQGYVGSWRGDLDQGHERRQSSDRAVDRDALVIAQGVRTTHCLPGAMAGER